MEDWFYAGVPGVPGSGVEGRAPDIRYDRVAAALYAGDNPNCWGAVGGISAMFEKFQGQGYPTVYALYQASNLIDVGYPTAFPRVTPGSPGDLAYRNAGAVVIECHMDDCLYPGIREQFFRVIEETHARGQSFVWFTGYHPESGIGSSGWLAKIQLTYNAIAAARTLAARRRGHAHQLLRQLPRATRAQPGRNPGRHRHRNPGLAPRATPRSLSR